jgi:hypothetical protein
MDEALVQLTREWLTKALHDMQTARSRRVHDKESS